MTKHSNKIILRLLPCNGELKPIELTWAKIRWHPTTVHLN